MQGLFRRFPQASFLEDNNMKRKLIIAMALALSAATLPGLATASDAVTIKVIADSAGMSDRHVRMLLGSARTPYSEYRMAFSRIEHQFVQAIGKERYRDLLAGKPVQLERIVDGRTVVVEVKLDRKS